MTGHVILQLVARRAKLAGEMNILQSRLHQIHTDLSSLDDVIKQFDPEFALATIRPKYRRQVAPAEVASISRAVLDTLRRGSDPMAAKAIAQAIMTDRGLDQTDRALVRSMAKRVDMALRYQRTNGMVGEVNHGSAGIRWEVAV